MPHLPASPARASRLIFAPVGCVDGGTVPHRAGPTEKEAVMAKKSSRQCSEQERAERRCADRERLRRAAEELLSSEGWARWVRVRTISAPTRRATACCWLT